MLYSLQKKGKSFRLNNVILTKIILQSINHVALNSIASNELKSNAVWLGAVYVNDITQYTILETIFLREELNDDALILEEEVESSDDESEYNQK